MLTKDVLLKRAKREKIQAITTKTPIQTIAIALAMMTARKFNTAVPKCFGRLYNLTESSSECHQCKLEPYCEIVFTRIPLTGNTIAESDLQDTAPFGFKEGSRAARFIKAWKFNLFTKGELRALSRAQFESLIDIERILAELRKRNLLIHDGKYFGIRRQAA